MLRASLAVAVTSFMMENGVLLSYAVVGTVGAMALGLVLGRKSRIWY